MSSSHPSSPSSSTAELQVTSEMTPRQTMRGHTNSVRGAVCLPDGRRIITCSWDGSLRLWSMESGKQIGDNWRDEEEEEEEDDADVSTMALSPNSKTVASGSGSFDRKVRLWDVETGKVIARWTKHSGPVNSVCWSPNGERVLSGCYDGTARVWDVESGETILGPIKTGDQYVLAVAYSPDGSKFATAGFTSGAKIWDSITGEQLHHLLQHKYSAEVWCLVWTSDAEKLMCGSFRSIRIFDTATWNEIAHLDTHKGIVTAIALSSNNRFLASTSSDYTARLWDLETNLQIGLPLYHRQDVRCATLSADGMCLVTGCNDTNTYMWDVGAILKEHHLEHLLPISDAVSDGDRKSFLNADATGVEEEDTYQPPPDFFHDRVDSAETHQPRRSARHRLGALASSLASRPNALFGRLSSLLRRPQRSTNEVTTKIPLPQIIPSAPISTTARVSLHYLSNLWPIRSGHSPSLPIVDVPFAQGRQRIATAGAPARHDDCVLDEDFDSPPPSPNPNSQQAPATDHVPSPPPPSNLNSHPSAAVERPPGEHGGSRLCFCF